MINLLAVLCALLTLVDLERRKKTRKTKMFLGKKLTCHAETGKKQDSKEVQVTLTKISNTRGNKTITTPLAHENSEVCKSLHGSTKLSA